MDRPTVEIYEHRAEEFAARRRRHYRPEQAEAFARSLRVSGRRLDLGTGPGNYLPHLGTPVVAADAAPAMLAVARRDHAAPGRLIGVACDLEAMPFPPGTFAGVWACKSLQHIPAERLPMALAGLHRVVEVGGVLDVTVFTGDGVAASGADDDFPGRLFAWWRPERLGQTLVGAGFDVEAVEVPEPDHEHGRMTATARRARTLPDTVGPDMRLLVVGLNPSLYAADAGVGFARPGNRFWPAARAAGLVSVDRDPDAALRRDGVGMTDLVKRATVAASELTAAEYRQGFARVEHLVGWLRPGAVCFVGLAGWRAAVDRTARAGVQPEPVAGTPVYVMPSTSGLNARSSLAELTDHLRAAAALAASGPG